MRKAGRRPPGMRLRTLLLFGFLLGSLSSCQVVRVERLPLLRNLAPNPGFEEEAGGVPQGWRRILLPGGRPPGPSRTQGRLSPQALYFAPKAHVEWRAQVDGVRPGRHYQLTFLVKREGWRDGEYPHLRIFGRETRLNELFSWGGWRKVRHVFRASGEESTDLAFIGRGLAHGFAIDDVELLEIAFEELRPRAGEEIQGGRPVFSWRLPPNDLVIRQEIEISRDSGLRNPTVIELMSPQGSQVRLLQSLAGGEWHWRVRAFLGVEEVAQSSIQSFRVPEGGGPSDPLPGRLRVDPPPIRPSFFPIGIFDPRPEGFEELKEAGFNSALIDSNPKTLEAAERHGLKAIVSHKTLGDPGFGPLARRASLSPALLGWYIEDEAEGRGVPPAAIWRKTALTRTFSPSRLTSLALLRSGQARYYGDAVDVVMVDPYPIPTQPLTWLSDSIEEVRHALGPEKPVWAIIQAFEWAHDPLYPQDRPSRYPTLAEHRALIYLAVAHGARGVIFFSDLQARKDTQHWGNLKRIAGELRCLYPLLSSDAEPQVLAQVNPPLDPKGRPAIHYKVKRLASNHPPASGCPNLSKGRYLFTVNPWRNPHPFHLEGFAPDARRAVALLGGSNLPIVRGALRDILGPLEVRLWQIAKEN